MSDATRYFSIPQTDFQQYYTFAPAGDPCSVDGYEVYRPPVFVNVGG